MNTKKEFYEKNLSTIFVEKNKKNFVIFLL